jgi:hypothetical protein
MRNNEEINTAHFIRRNVRSGRIIPALYASEARIYQIVNCKLADFRFVVMIFFK